ncbi:MAG: hypothetical protein NVS3B5_11120 [Sphingomicrobium sp.]
MRKASTILALGSIVVSLGGCEVKKTQQGKMPKVEMKTSGGQLPAYNVQGPDVQVGSKTETFKVPTVHVTTPREKDQANRNSS